MESLKTKRLISSLCLCCVSNIGCSNSFACQIYTATSNEVHHTRFTKTCKLNTPPYIPHIVQTQSCSYKSQYICGLSCEDQCNVKNACMCAKPHFHRPMFNRNNSHRSQFQPRAFHRWTRQQLLKSIDICCSSHGRQDARNAKETHRNFKHMNWQWLDRTTT